MVRSWLIFVAVFLGLTGNAQAALPVARWNAESHINTTWTAGQLLVSSGRCPTALPSCTESNRRPVHIWLQHADGPLRWTYYHELGHAFDALVLTDLDRDRITRLMGLHAPWVRGVPNAIPERFAEAFKLCAMLGAHVTQARIDRVTWFGYRWMPTARRQRRVCRAIAALAGQVRGA